MPPHSSHLLQPLNISYFAPLKRAYRCQAKALMRNNVNYINKTLFLLYFITAYKAAIIRNNILGGFRGAGLVLFDLEAVILKLNIRLHTPLVTIVEDGP